MKGERKLHIPLGHKYSLMGGFVVTCLRSRRDGRRESLSKGGKVLLTAALLRSCKVMGRTGFLHCANQLGKENLESFPGNSEAGRLWSC